MLHKPHARASWRASLAANEQLQVLQYLALAGLSCPTLAGAPVSSIPAETNGGVSALRMSLASDFRPFKEPAFLITIAIMVVGVAAMFTVIYIGAS